MEHITNLLVPLLLTLLLMTSELLADDNVEEHTFFMKPGGGKLSVQAVLQNKYSCILTYAAQGGTHEEWIISLSLVENGGRQVICSVKRAGSSSYLYIQEFVLELTGPMVSLTHAELKNSQRDNLSLGKDEYLLEKNSVSSVAKTFKNHLEHIIIYSHLSHSDL